MSNVYVSPRGYVHECLVTAVLNGIAFWSRRAFCAFVSSPIVWLVFSEAGAVGGTAMACEVVSSDSWIPYQGVTSLCNDISIVKVAHRTTGFWRISPEADERQRKTVEFDATTLTFWVLDMMYECRCCSANNPVHLKHLPRVV